MENLVQSPSHYVWEVAGKPVSIHLDFNVVDRLAMDVMRGFGAVPKRGAEVGGLLIGSIETGEKLVVRIEDFVPVTCDYLRGPSFQLTEKDEARFAEAVERVKQARGNEPKLVGYYRSHTREALALSDEDLNLFGRYLGDPNQIMLLVRPFATRTSIGAFFFQENGSFRRESSYQEFPFKRRDLGGGTSLPMRSAPRETAEIGTIAEETPGSDLRDWLKSRGDSSNSILQAEKPKPTPGSSTAQFRSKWVWIPLSFVFLILGVVVGFQAALMLNKPGAELASASTMALDLTAKMEAGKVIIRWDRNSAPVRNAASGTLRIMDGEFSKMVNLDTRQLQNGSVIYMSAENKVGFRLEVTMRQKTLVSESVDFVPGSH